MEKRDLIKVPRKLIRVTAEKHWYHGDLFGTIVIETDKGIYEITGCPECEALEWRKVKPEGDE